MADDIVENKAADEEPEDRKYTNEDIDRIVKRRLRGMNSEHEEMRGRMEDLQKQLEAKAQEAPQESPDTSQQVDEPLTRGALTDALEANRKSQMEDMQQAQLKNALTHHINNVDKMKNEDPKFRKLEEDTNLGIPAEVGIHLSNNLDHDTSKKLFKELLSNETSNLKMQNAFLTGSFDKWLNQVLTNQADDKEAPSPSPDLTSQNSRGAEGGGFNNIEDYLGGL